MNIKKKIKILLHPFETIMGSINAAIDNINCTLQKDRFEKQALVLTNQALNSKDSGISSEKICNEDVIVSLTSYGKRIHDVYLAIESIMQGSLKPNRIILWLSSKEFKGKVLPITLQNQVKRGLEIRFCKDIRSYKKLVYAMKVFPNAVIITIDDDVIYYFDFIEKLITSHNKKTSCIYANRVHHIKTNLDGSLMPYLDWDWETPSNLDDHNLFFTGVGGVLYPPRSLHEEVFNEDVFMELCPTADDVWFNAMARLQKTEICRSFTHDPKGNDFLVNENLQTDGLNSINNAPGKNQNDVQIKAIFEKYGIKIHASNNNSI